MYMYYKIYHIMLQYIYYGIMSMYYNIFFVNSITYIH